MFIISYTDVDCRKKESVLFSSKQLKGFISLYSSSWIEWTVYDDNDTLLEYGSNTNLKY